MASSNSVKHINNLNNNGLNERPSSPTKALLHLHEQTPTMIISTSIHSKSGGNSMIFDFRGKNVKPQLAITSPFGRSAVIGGDDMEVDAEKENQGIEAGVGGASDLSPALVFLGGNEIVGKGSLLKVRNKKLRIHFNDASLSSTYEYPSEAFFDQHFEEFVSASHEERETSASRATAMGTGASCSSADVTNSRGSACDKSNGSVNGEDRANKGRGSSSSAVTRTSSLVPRPASASGRSACHSATTLLSNHFLNA